jgi:hypothetical protein
LVICTRCDFVKSRLGLDHNGPDEFEVIPLAPLSIPNSYKKTPSKDESSKANDAEKVAKQDSSNESARANDILLHPQIHVENEPVQQNAAKTEIRSSDLGPIPNAEELRQLIKEAEEKSKELRRQMAEAAAARINAEKAVQSKESDGEGDKRKKKKNKKYDKAADVVVAEKKLEDANLSNSQNTRADTDTPVLNKPVTTEQSSRPSLSRVVDQFDSHASLPKPLTEEECKEIEFERMRERNRLEELKREALLLSGEMPNVVQQPETNVTQHDVGENNCVDWTSVSPRQIAEHKNVVRKFCSTPRNDTSFAQPNYLPVPSPVIHNVEDSPILILNEPSVSPVNSATPVNDASTANAPSNSTLETVGMPAAVPALPQTGSNPVTKPVAYPVVHSGPVKAAKRRVPVRRRKGRAGRRKRVRPKKLWLAAAQKGQRVNVAASPPAP